MQRNIGPVLADLKASAITTIDSQAGWARSQFLTTIPGQAETYMYKLADCQAYLEATNPNVSNHPWVAGEADAQGQSPLDAALFVVATYNAWQKIGIAIENARLAGKAAVRDATTAADACTGRDTATAALQAIVQQYG